MEIVSGCIFGWQHRKKKQRSGRWGVDADADGQLTSHVGAPPMSTSVRTLATVQVKIYVFVPFLLR